MIVFYLNMILIVKNFILYIIFTILYDKVTGMLNYKF